MDYDSWKCGYYEAREEHYCMDCKTNEKQKEDMVNYLKNVIDVLYRLDSEAVELDDNCVKSSLIYLCDYFNINVEKYKTSKENVNLLTKELKIRV